MPEPTSPHSQATDTGAPVTEYEILDLLFEALPDDVQADLYDVREDLPRPEFYLKVRGECWRITAQPHPHPANLGPCEACIEDRIDPPNPATHIAQGSEGPYAACDRADHAPAPAGQNTPALARPSTAFERPAGNIFTVPDDGGSPLEDLSERPAIIAPTAITEHLHDPNTPSTSPAAQEQPDE